MKIEIAEPGRMTQSGSSLLRLIQNNDMPILDLLVRESIQNSLDAYREDAKYVNVEFLTGEFDSKSLNSHLQGIQEELNNRYEGRESRYIAIRDSNTKGLTGKLHFDDVENNDYGNLLKLIYEISKPQESLGAGGSWGLGKTVYFRIGIGLVIYYSRILDENNEYESRLAVSMIEDENSVDSIIPSINGKIKRGIAWWGESIGENKTRPITNETEIEEILDIFNIRPYSNEETGTTILIPYINAKELLNSNRLIHENDDKQEQLPFWHLNIEEFIKVSVQRWYAPRLNNHHYNYGRWLRVLVNGEGIGLDSMEPIFKLIQGLYNKAIQKESLHKDLQSTHINVKAIKLRNVLLEQQAGWVAYTKISKSLLKMTPPTNKLSPYIYINQENLDGDTNRPIVLFTRKPGMIVSYETSGPWVDSIPSSGKDEFIIAVFVLNSNNMVVGMGESLNLEEYIRKSEMADHTSWSDWGNSQLNPRIINKVQGHIRAAITKSYKEDDNTNGNKLNSGLGKLFGDLLLPPENFGKKPSPGNDTSPKSKVVAKHKGASLRLDNDSIKFTSSGVQIRFKVECPSKISQLNLETFIAMESGRLSVEQWEDELGQEMPFEVISVLVDKIGCRGEQARSCDLRIDNCSTEMSTEGMNLKFLYSKNGIPYGLSVTTKEKASLTIEGTMVIKVKQKNIRTVLNIFTNEGEK